MNKKAYKIVAECSDAENEYIVEVYTDSFAQAINICNEAYPLDGRVDSRTLFAMMNEEYVQIGTIC